MDIFERLKADHRRQRDLAARVLEAPDGSCEMQRLFDELRDAVEAHAAAEEQTFYADLLAFPGGRTLVQQSVADHDQTAILIDHLADNEFCTPAWLTDVAGLVSLLDRRCSTEEAEAFALTRALIDPARAERLGERYVEAKRQWLATFGRQPLADHPPTTPESLPSQPASANSVPSGVTAGRRRPPGLSFTAAHRPGSRALAGRCVR